MHPWFDLQLTSETPLILPFATQQSSFDIFACAISSSSLVCESLSGPVWRCGHSLDSQISDFCHSSTKNIWRLTWGLDITVPPNQNRETKQTSAKSAVALPLDLENKVSGNIPTESFILTNAALRINMDYILTWGWQKHWIIIHLRNVLKAESIHAESTHMETAI